MYRQYCQSRGVNGMQTITATYSTFTPPHSVFQTTPEHVNEFKKEVYDSVGPETAILHAKSTLTMSQWNCHCKKITCIKIRKENQKDCDSNRSSVSGTVYEAGSPTIVHKNRKYIARMTSSVAASAAEKQKNTTSPTMKRISRNLTREMSPLPQDRVKMRSVSVGRRQKRQAASYSQYLTGQPRLPSYARIADSLDHILRICSKLRQLVMMDTKELEKDEFKEEIINKAKALLYVLQRSAYAYHLFEKSCGENSGLLECLESISQIDSPDDLPEVTTAFIDIIKKLIEEVVHLNCWIIINYLDDCDSNDCLLPVSLNHLTHLMLFESEPCLEVIQSSTMQNLLALCEIPTTPTRTVLLLLRCVAVLCSVRAACVQLLSLGGFALILDHFLQSTIECAMESAGILCQLTRPNYGLIELGRHLTVVVNRLLQLVDNHCSNPDSLLFCLHVLANVSGGVNSGDSEAATCVFEETRAVHRILRTVAKKEMRSCLVDEQVLSILLHFPDAVPQNDVLPFLFSVLNNSNPEQVKSAIGQRLKQKATLCLRLIGSSSEEEEMFSPIKIRPSPSGSSQGFHSNPSPSSTQESSTS